MKTFTLNSTNIDNLHSDICFLSSAVDYKISGGIPDIVKQVIIFIPYHYNTNEFKANAKRISLKLQNINIIQVDTKYTYIVAQKCNYLYSELTSTLIMAIFYILSNGYDQVIIEDLKCFPKELSLINSLESQKKVKLISGAEKSVKSVEQKLVSEK